eukprot:scaffold77732_cov25-Prasinocladus_malaysianus.AAC.2
MGSSRAHHITCDKHEGPSDMGSMTLQRMVECSLPAEMLAASPNEHKCVLSIILNNKGAVQGSWPGESSRCPWDPREGRCSCRARRLRRQDRFPRPQPGGCRSSRHRPTSAGAPVRPHQDPMSPRVSRQGTAPRSLQSTPSGWKGWGWSHVGTATGRDANIMIRTH